MYSRNIYHATWNNKTTISWYWAFSIHLLQQTGVEPTKEAVEAGRAYEQMLLVISSGPRGCLELTNLDQVTILGKVR